MGAICNGRGLKISKLVLICNCVIHLFFWTINQTGARKLLHQGIVSSSALTPLFASKDSYTGLSTVSPGTSVRTWSDMRFLRHHTLLYRFPSPLRLAHYNSCSALSLKTSWIRPDKCFTFCLTSAAIQSWSTIVKRAFHLFGVGTGSTCYSSTLWWVHLASSQFPALKTVSELLVYAASVLPLLLNCWVRIFCSALLIIQFSWVEVRWMQCWSQTLWL